MRMLGGHTTQPSERFIGLFPACKLPFNCLDHTCQRGEVTIVQAKTARQLPDALDRIQIRAIGRQVTQYELRFLLRSPFCMKLGVVILGIVRNDDYSTPGPTAALSDQQHPVKAVIISRLVRATDFVLQREDHGFGITNLQWLHCPIEAQLNSMRNYL